MFILISYRVLMMGPKNLEISLEMAKRAIVNNIREMIVTPHFSFKYNYLDDIDGLKKNTVNLKMN